MNLSEQILHQDGRYQAAWRQAGHTGDAFSVDQPHRSSWPIVAVCFLIFVVGLGAMELLS